MGNNISTAPCRFCGQMVQIEADGKLTKPQAEEKATMSCYLHTDFGIHKCALWRGLHDETV